MGTTGGTDAAAVQARVGALARQFAAQRGERQRRRELDPADFAALAETGFLLTGVPAEQGGLWQSAARSTRTAAELLRTLARGDSSVALVCAMHPAVLAFWLASPEAAPESQGAWAAQRRWVADTARDGAWWGTITSEPGSGGDVTRTRMTARPGTGTWTIRERAGAAAAPGRAGGTGGTGGTGGGDGGGDGGDGGDGRAAADGTAGTGYRVSGVKHFGSGSGVTSFMLTTALPEGEDEPDWFFLDVRGVSWDGSAGATLVAPWDGHGMAATQSHSLRFDAYPATRFAWRGQLLRLQANAGPFVACCFTAVIAGIAEVALETARQQLAPRQSSLGAYEQTEWVRADLQGWLIRQAYEGVLRAVEEQPSPLGDVLRGKTVVAELAESALTRVCRVLGGGAYGRASPYGYWFEDVRALGFLRPPWALAYDRLIEAALVP